MLKGNSDPNATKDRCVREHDLTDPDNYKEYKGADGVWRRYCVQCNKIRQQESRDRRKRGKQSSS